MSFARFSMSTPYYYGLYKFPTFLVQSVDVTFSGQNKVYMVCTGLQWELYTPMPPHEDSRQLRDGRQAPRSALDKNGRHQAIPPFDWCLLRLILQQPLLPFDRQPQKQIILSEARQTRERQKIAVDQETLTAVSGSRA